MPQIIDQGLAIISQPDSARQSLIAPQICVLPSGRWLLGCRAAPVKTGNHEQHILLAISDDEGRSWRVDRPAIEPPDFRGMAGAFRAIGLTALGSDTVLATLYWIDQSDPDRPLFNSATDGLLDSRLMLARSDDGGRSWGAPWFVDLPDHDIPTPITGPVLALPDGQLAAQFEVNKHYDDPSPWQHQSVLAYSTDGGRTWPRHSVSSSHPSVFYWDQRPAVLPGGRIIDAFWTYDTAAAAYLPIHLRWTDDRGQTWSPMHDTGVPGQPAPIAPLPDGRLALVHVDREAAPAIRLRLSDDGGLSWPADSDITLYDSTLPNQTEHKSDTHDAITEMEKFAVGLPATAVLPDGDILVVYYAGDDSDHTHIHWCRIRF